MRYTGPKNRISRREGTDLGLKTLGSKAQAQLLRKMGVLPGQHGVKGRRKVSEHGIQLREKQKLRYMYGVTEKQLKNYFTAAAKRKGNTATHLTQSLENRLDNVVYRLGFAPTRAASRQLVSHKHITVNNKVVGIPSYSVRIGDVIGFALESSSKIPFIEKSLSNKDTTVPQWIDRKAISGKVLDLPHTDEIEKNVNLRLIVEYYSR